MYLRDKENLQEGLFKEFIDNVNKDVIDCIHFFWVIRKEPEANNYKQKTIDFWKYRFSLIKGKEKQHINELSQFNKLSIYVDKIDKQTFKMLKVSVKYAEIQHNTIEVMEFFEKKCVEYPDKISELFYIFLKGMLKYGNVVYRYLEKDVKGILETFYQKGNAKTKERTHKIINLYGENGIEDFRDLYKNHKNKN